MLRGILTYIEMPKMSKTRFFHEWGRHRSYGRADTQLLHEIMIRIQWNTSRTLIIKKKNVTPIPIFLYKLKAKSYQKMFAYH